EDGPFAVDPRSLSPERLVKKACRRIIAKHPARGAGIALGDQMLRHGAHHRAPEPALLRPPQQIERRKLHRKTRLREARTALTTAGGETTGRACLVIGQKHRAGAIALAA